MMLSIFLCAYLHNFFREMSPKIHAHFRIELFFIIECFICQCIPFLKIIILKKVFPYDCIVLLFHFFNFIYSIFSMASLYFDLHVEPQSHFLFHLPFLPRSQPLRELVGAGKAVVGCIDCIQFSPCVEDLNIQHHFSPVLGFLVSGIFFEPAVPVIQLVNSFLWLEQYPEDLLVCRAQLPLYIDVIVFPSVTLFFTDQLPPQHLPQGATSQTS